jgi:hypothetical protein
MNPTTLEEITRLASGPISILLGAGASGAFSLPTMFNFLNSAYGDAFISTITECPPYKMNANDIKSVANNRVAMLKRLLHTVALNTGRLSYDLEDIFQFIHNTRVLYGDAEAVQSLFWMFRVCNEGQSWNLTTYQEQAKQHKTALETWLSDFQETIDELRSLMYKRFLITPAQKPILAKAQHSYSIIKKLFVNSNATVFTTNFDTVFEALQRSKGLAWNLVDGTGSQRNPPFSFEQYLQHKNTPSLFLFKLHGSVTWQRNEDGTIDDCFPMVPEAVALLEPVISKLPTGYPFEDMYRIFSSVIQENKIFVAIGFSFRDDTIRKLVMERLASSLPFHLVILAPEEKNVHGADKYLKELETSEKVTRIRGYFGDAETESELLHVVETQRQLLFNN